MSPPAAHTVVITACGTATAHGLARSLRERWGSTVRIVGADAGPPELIAGRSLFDAVHQVPLFDDPRYDAALDTILAAEERPVYRPLMDAEIAHGARRAADGELPNSAQMPWPGVRAAETCADKLVLAHRLQEAEVPVAPTWTARDVPWDPRGIVTKPRTGFGSIGVKTFASEDALEHDRDVLPHDHVGQPRLEEPEITVDAWAAPDETTRAVARERLGVRGGVATKCRVYEDEALTQLAARLTEVLQIAGPFCFQVLHDAGRPLITDLNARPGGATRMTVVAGVDLHCAPFAALWGLPFEDELEPLPEPKLVLRHFEETVV